MKGRPTPPGEKGEVARTMMYFMFGQAFGWTPGEVDELDAHTAELLILLLNRTEGGASKQDMRKFRHYK